MGRAGSCRISSGIWNGTALLLGFVVFLWVVLRDGAVGVGCSIWVGTFGRCTNVGLVLCCYCWVRGRGGCRFSLGTSQWCRISVGCNILAGAFGRRDHFGLVPCCCWVRFFRCLCWCVFVRPARWVFQDDAVVLVYHSRIYHRDGVSPAFQSTLPTIDVFSA